MKGSERRPGMQHPEEWRQDLNPDALEPETAAETGRTAYDVKPVHRRFHDLADDELKRIPILPVGMQLKQGSTYIDLRADDPDEFVATSEMVAGPGQYIVPKAEVDYQLWNRLIGVQEPERLGAADDS